MADYNAILRRTLDGLGATTPELREKLFVRARTTIARQLETANPPMTAEAVVEQKAHLEAAIAGIENEYLSKESAEAPTPDAPSQPATEAPLASAEPVSPVAAVPVHQPPVEIPAVPDEPVGVPVAEDQQYEPAGNVEPATSSGGRSTLIIIIASLIIIGGGLTALWLNRTSLMEAYNQFISSDEPSVAETTDNSSATSENSGSPSSVSNVKDDGKLPKSTTAESAVTEKFDQRLNESGEETAAEPMQANNDTLPAGVEPSPVTTTRIIVPNIIDNPEDTAVEATATSPEAATTPAAETTTLLVAQKGLLYEEGASKNKNTIDVGTVVWSIVQEAPGDGLPLEPAIRAKVEISGRDLVLLMTIKRNADPALPASHIIELVFSVPGDFSGGSIERIQRFVFKQSEQARGEALVGVPATIADGIFLIALNNLPEAMERNTALMKQQEWIDIPLGYKTGRRALITLEKGVPGGRVFKEVFAAWEKAG